jgi:hypothetical protein
MSWYDDMGISPGLDGDDEAEPTVPEEAFGDLTLVQARAAARPSPTMRRWAYTEGVRIWRNDGQ